MESLWRTSGMPWEADATPQPFPVGRRFDVVVVGAGLTGLTTALLFARAGRTVAVVEARDIGAVATGNSTAKLSLLQGSRLATVLRHRSLPAAQAYVEANLEGREWLLRYCADHGVTVQHRDAVTYATTQDGAERVRQEHRAAVRLGLPVTLAEGPDSAPELPFATAAALTLPGQAQFDPMDVLRALADDVRAHGGVIFEHTRLVGARADDPVEVRTSRGPLQAGHLVLATGTPVLDRGLYFARLSAQRSYALAFTVPGPVPQGMYLSLDSSTRSLRTARVDGEERLLVGGAGHAVGRASSPRASVDTLEQWTRRNFAGAERTHAWSAQDYEPVSGVPYVGPMPRGRWRILVASGYDKWGMTNAVAASLALSQLVLGGHMRWADRLYRHGISTADVASAVGAGAAVGAWLVRGYASAWGRLVRQHPFEGCGEVGRSAPGPAGLRPVGRCTVDGVTSSVSAVCPHLGGVLSWNDAELSWDCPLHGSRFTAEGTLLEGPAARDLRVAGQPRHGL